VRRVGARMECGAVSSERAVGFDQQAGWRELTERWSRRISLFTALAIGLASFLACWAIAIKFGSWFGVFLGWWPALMIGSLAALLAARIWPVVLLLAVTMSLSGGREALSSTLAFATSQFEAPATQSSAAPNS
jgi:hypothetical protein